MAKRKRERMKQKAMRHKSEEAMSNGAVEEEGVDSTTELKSQPQSKPKPSASSSKTALTEPPHLIGASPEWKKWYAAVSEAIAASR